MLTGSMVGRSDQELRTCYALMVRSAYKYRKVWRSPSPPPVLMVRGIPGVGRIREFIPRSGLSWVAVPVGAARTRALASLGATNAPAHLPARSFLDDSQRSSERIPFRTRRVGIERLREALASDLRTLITQAGQVRIRQSSDFLQLPTALRVEPLFGGRIGCEDWQCRCIAVYPCLCGK